ncbi:hypothetical protein [Amphibiibacter pelophylacis]|uniref:Uncharacterized protein n=1 Tax=Amphibiibacter pelophylacis TaxID=1799477 RepID=A0ACC6NZU1_9BURK
MRISQKSNVPIIEPPSANKSLKYLKGYCFVYRVNLFILLVLISADLSGCGFSSIDAPSPGPSQLWTKPGAAENEVVTDSKICSDKVKPLHDSAKFDKYTSCMLDKGYKFVLSPKGFQSFCDESMMSTLACRSAESGFIWPKAD